MLGRPGLCGFHFVKDVELHAGAGSLKSRTGSDLVQSSVFDSTEFRLTSKPYSETNSDGAWRIVGIIVGILPGSPAERHRSRSVKGDDVVIFEIVDEGIKAITIGRIGPDEVNTRLMVCRLPEEVIGNEIDATRKEYVRSRRDRAN